jgi:hypothetical protein
LLVGQFFEKVTLQFSPLFELRNAGTLHLVAALGNKGMEFDRFRGEQWNPKTACSAIL